MKINPEELKIVPSPNSRQLTHYFELNNLYTNLNKTNYILFYKKKWL
jgi:hypothetical protein